MAALEEVVPSSFESSAGDSYTAMRTPEAFSKGVGCAGRPTRSFIIQ